MLKLTINKCSKEGSTVIKNVGYLSLLQIAGYIFPLITMPYLARIIGSEGFGKIAFASGLIVWIQTIADWGFNFTATRDVAQNRDDKVVVSQIFSNVLWARFFLTLVSALLLGLAILIIPYLQQNALVIVLTFLAIPGHILFPDWFFQAIEKMKFITIFNLLMKFIFTVSVFFFIKEKNDYVLQPLLTTIGYIVCGVFSLFLIIKKWNYKIYSPNWRSIKSTISSSTDVFINNLVPNFYNSLSVILLGFFSGATANGIYDGGSRFVSIARNFQLVVSRAFFPFLARKGDRQHKIFSRLNISISFVMFVVLFGGAPYFVDLLLSAEFHDSILILRVLSLSLVGMAVYNTYGINYLVVRHFEKYLRKITILTSLFGFLICFPLIYWYSALGVALTITLSRLVLGIMSYCAYRKLSNSIVENVPV